MGIKTFTIALSLCTLAGCVGDAVDSDDEAQDQERTDQPKVELAVTTTAVSTKQAIGNIRR